MSIRNTQFVAGEYYHVYNRGNSKQKIFLDKKDYLRFSYLLFISNSDESFNFTKLERNSSRDIYDIERNEEFVSIGAYCLMPNHFHILLTEKREGGITKFMQKLSTAYSMYFNKKYERNGSLFEGKFKSQHAITDRQLKYLFSYINLNPVKLIQKDWRKNGIKNKKEVIDYLNKYPHSSYYDFIGIKRSSNSILDLKAFPSYFPNEDSFRAEIFDWLDYNQT